MTMSFAFSTALYPVHSPQTAFGSGGFQRHSARHLCRIPKSKPSPDLRPPSPIRWARDISFGGAAASFVAALCERRPSVTDRRYKAYFAPDGALAVGGWGCYKYVSPDGLSCGLGDREVTFEFSRKWQWTFRADSLDFSPL